jgi:small-conductance mechanosensitive channel/CRP-like cAMP-binding protein
MTPTLIPAAVLIAIAIVGGAALRQFPDRVRLGFDAICFAAISAFLLHQGVSPVFPPPHLPLTNSALWVRVVGGAWWLLGARLLVAILWVTFHRDRRSRATKRLSDLTAGAIYLVTALVVLNTVFALPITGVLATSGVFAIVLGLALQNTLADVFAGIAVGIEAPFRVGDRVQIGDKVEGQVVQVNWRSIRIQTDGEDVAIIPNSVVAKAEIINRSFPTERRAASVALSWPAYADPERVIETLLQATLLCPAILQTPAPTATLTSLRPERNYFSISFFVDSTKHLARQKGELLLQARRQLHYAELYSKSVEADDTPPGTDAQSAFAVRLIRDLTLFDSLSQEQISRLAAALTCNVLAPGDVLFSQDASDATLYIIAAGVVTLEHRTELSAPAVVGRIGAGDYIGELGLLTGAPHEITATAQTHSRVYQLSRDAIAPLLSETPALVTAVDRSARRGLEELHREVEARATQNVGDKGQLLLRMRRFFHVQST